MSETSDTGVIDSCRTCKKVKWAGTHPDCDSCRAKKKMLPDPPVPHGAKAGETKEK